MFQIFFTLSAVKSPPTPTPHTHTVDAVEADGTSDRSNSGAGYFATKNENSVAALAHFEP